MSAPPATSSAMAAALRTVPLFAGVAPAVLDGVAARTAAIAVAPGRLVLDGDDETTDVLFVLEGSIRVSVHAADGEHARILGDFHAGDFVGELSAIDGAPRSARVEALTRTRLCAVPAAVFLGLAAECPPVGLRIMRMLTARIRSQNQALLQHTTLPARLRIAAELLRTSRPRGDGTLVISPPPTQQNLADRVGSCRETVSREMGALVEAGLLQRNRVSIVLSRPAALRALVEQGPRRQER